MSERGNMSSQHSVRSEDQVLRRPNSTEPVAIPLAPVGVDQMGIPASNSEEMLNIPVGSHVSRTPGNQFANSFLFPREPTTPLDAYDVQSPNSAEESMDKPVGVTEREIELKSIQGEKGAIAINIDAGHDYGNEYDAFQTGAFGVANGATHNESSYAPSYNSWTTNDSYANQMQYRPTTTMFGRGEEWETASFIDRIDDEIIKGERITRQKKMLIVALLRALIRYGSTTHRTEHLVHKVADGQGVKCTAMIMPNLFLLTFSEKDRQNDPTKCTTVALPLSAGLDAYKLLQTEVFASHLVALKKKKQPKAKTEQNGLNKLMYEEYVTKPDAEMEKDRSPEQTLASPHVQPTEIGDFHTLYPTKQHRYNAIDEEMPQSAEHVQRQLKNVRKRKAFVPKVRSTWEILTTLQNANYNFTPDCPFEMRAAQHAIVSEPGLYPIWFQSLLLILVGITSTALFFGGSGEDCLVGFLLSCVVSAIFYLSSIFPRLAPLQCILSTILVSFLAHVIRYYWYPQTCMYPVMLAACLWHLPGWSITTSVIELASRSMISGTVRFINAIFTTLQLGFGLAIGSKLLFWDTVQTTLPCGPAISRYWEFITFPVLALAMGILMGGHPRQYPGMVVTAVVALYGNKLLADHVPSDLVNMLTALAVGISANFLALLMNDQPLTFLMTGILLLVPGGISVKGAAAMFAKNGVESLSFFSTMFSTVISIAVGLLVAKLLFPNFTNSSHYTRKKSISGYMGSELLSFRKDTMLPPKKDYNDTRQNLQEVMTQQRQELPITSSGFFNHETSNSNNNAYTHDIHNQTENMDMPTYAASQQGPPGLKKPHSFSNLQQYRSENFLPHEEESNAVSDYMPRLYRNGTQMHIRAESPLSPQPLPEELHLSPIVSPKNDVYIFSPPTEAKTVLADDMQEVQNLHSNSTNYAQLFFDPQNGDALSKGTNAGSSQRRSMSKDDMYISTSGMNFSNNYMNNMNTNMNNNTNNMNTNMNNSNKTNLTELQQNLELQLQQLQMQSQQLQQQLQQQKQLQQQNLQSMPLQPQNMPLQPQNIPLQPQNIPLQPQNISLQPQNIPLQPQNIQLQPPTQPIITIDPMTGQQMFYYPGPQPQFSTVMRNMNPNGTMMMGPSNVLPPSVQYAPANNMNNIVYNNPMYPVPIQQQQAIAGSPYMHPGLMTSPNVNIAQTGSNLSMSTAQPHLHSSQSQQAMNTMRNQHTLVSGQNTVYTPSTQLHRINSSHLANSTHLSRINSATPSNLHHTIGPAFLTMDQAIALQHASNVMKHLEEEDEEEEEEAVVEPDDETGMDAMM